LTNKMILSSTASKAIASLSEKDRLVVKTSLEKIAHYEIDELINSTRVLRVGEDKNYFSFRASSNIRVFFQIEDYSIVVLDIASIKYTGINKTFLNLFIFSSVVLAIFIYLGTAGSKYFIAVVATKTPIPIVIIFPLTPPATVTPTLTSTATPYGTPPPTVTYTSTTAPSTYTPYPTYTMYPSPTLTSLPLISDQVMNIGGWVFGTATSCLTSIIAFIGFISTTMLAWKKEAREAQNTKLDYEKTIIELERMRIELETVNKQKTKKKKIDEIRKHSSKFNT